MNSPNPTPPAARVTQFEVCALPEDHIDYPTFAITVDYRGHGKWAVTRGRRCLGVDGFWDWEPLPSEREAAWLEEHRFSLAEALELAAGAAPSVQINGARPQPVEETGSNFADIERFARDWIGDLDEIGLRNEPDEDYNMVQFYAWNDDQEVDPGMVIVVDREVEDRGEIMDADAFRIAYQPEVS